MSAQRRKRLSKWSGEMRDRWEEILEDLDSVEEHYAGSAHVTGESMAVLVVEAIQEAVSKALQPLWDIHHNIKTGKIPVGPLQEEDVKSINSLVNEINSCSFEDWVGMYPDIDVSDLEMRVKETVEYLNRFGP
jgi:hypothetical protein